MHDSRFLDKKVMFGFVASLSLARREALFRCTNFSLETRKDEYLRCTPLKKMEPILYKVSFEPRHLPELASIDRAKDNLISFMMRKC